MKHPLRILLAVIAAIVIGSTARFTSAFENGRLIQVVYRPGDVEVGIDLCDIASMDLSRQDFPIKDPNMTFDINIHFHKSHTWEDVKIGIFSYYTDSNTPYAIFMTTQPTAPKLNKDFPKFKGAWDVTHSFYSLNDADNDGLCVVDPGDVQSYFSKMDLQTIPGQYAGLNRGYESSPNAYTQYGEYACEGFDHTPFADVYLYKVKQLGPRDCQLIEGATTPYIAKLRVFKNGAVRLNPPTQTQTFTLSVVMSGNGQGTVERDPHIPAYAQNQNVTLTAHPGTGSQFAGWGGALNGMQNPVTITMNSDKQVAATFSKIAPALFTLSVTPSEGGSVVLNPPGGRYDQGAEVEVNAVAAEGWIFAGWNGDISGLDNPSSIIMFGDRGIKAVFLRISWECFGDFDQDGDVDGEDLSAFHGCIDSSACSADLNGDGTVSGDDVDLFAQSFGRNDCIAHVPNYTLTTNVIGQGSIIVDPNHVNYPGGAEVTLTAVPDQGYRFDQWTGSIEESELSQVTVTMDADRSVTATFTQLPKYTLTVEKEGSGDVTKNETGYNAFRLTAEPQAGWKFERWEGDIEGTENPREITLTDNMEIKAVFSRVPYKLTTVVSAGKGTLDPEEGLYIEVTVVTLIARPKRGFRVSSWIGTDDDTSVANMNRVTINGDKQVTVKFAPISNADHDLLPDEEEMGPGGDNAGYDGNGDGVSDFLQFNVASLFNYADPNDYKRYYLTFASPELSQIVEMKAVDPNDPNLDLGEPPSNVSLVMGLFYFRITGLEPDGTTTVNLYLPPDVVPDTYYKYGPTPDQPVRPHWYPFMFDGSTGAEISGNQIILHFVDGERGDDDLLENGEIVDIGGPGVTQAASADGGTGTGGGRNGEEGDGGGGCFISALLMNSSKNRKIVQGEGMAGQQLIRWMKVNSKLTVP